MNVETIKLSNQSELEAYVTVESHKSVRTCYVSIINDVLQGNDIILKPIVLLGKNNNDQYKYEPFWEFKKELEEKQMDWRVMKSVCQLIDQKEVFCGQMRDGNFRYHIEGCRDFELFSLEMNIKNELFSVDVVQLVDGYIRVFYKNHKSLVTLLSQNSIPKTTLEKELGFLYSKLFKAYCQDNETQNDMLIRDITFSNGENPGIYYATVTYESDESIQIKILYHGENSISLHTVEDNTIIDDKKLREYIIERLEYAFSQNMVSRTLYRRDRKTQVQKEKTKLGRTKNAEGEKKQDCKLSSCNRCAKAPLLYYRDNQLLREDYLLKVENGKWYIDTWSERKTSRLKHLGDIPPSRLELLSWLNDLKYIHKEALLDMVEAGIINWGNDVKFDSALDSMYKYGLIDELKFVSIKKDCAQFSNGNRIHLEDKPPNTTIYTLGEAGAKLLRDTGREGQYNPFDRFQDGNVVKAKLAANQWLIYWLYAYRDKFSRQYYTSKKIYVRGIEQSGVRIHAAVKRDNTFIVGEPVRRTAKDLKKQFQDELLDKFDRFMIVFDNAKQDDIFSSYDKFFLPEKKIICYICEDLNHVDEVYYMLQSKREKYPNQEIWFTTDLKTHNYNEEGHRFIVFNKDGSQEFVDLNKRFDLGEERADWENKGKNTGLEVSILKN